MKRIIQICGAMILAIMAVGLSLIYIFTLEERLRDSDNTDYRFPVIVGTKASQRPVLDYYADDYSIQLYVPLEVRCV